MLIVCEGSRTEPLYFRDIADRYQLSTANVVVVGINAARALADAERTGEPNPSTEVHKSISYLQVLKLEPDR